MTDLNHEILICSRVHDAMPELRLAMTDDQWHEWLEFLADQQAQMWSRRGDAGFIQEYVQGCTDQLRTKATRVMGTVIRRIDADRVELNTKGVMVVRFARPKMPSVGIHVCLSPARHVDAKAGAGALDILFVDAADPEGEIADAVWRHATPEPPADVCEVEPHRALEEVEEAVSEMRGREVRAALRGTSRRGGGMAAANRGGDEPQREEREASVPHSEPEPQSLDEKAINFWIDEDGKVREAPLVVDEEYDAFINIGRRVAGSLTADSAAAAIPLADVPPQGLKTIWVVQSHTVALLAHPEDTDVRIDSVTEDGGVTQWTATFHLHIPRTGDAETRRIRVRPLTNENPVVRLLVFTDPDQSDFHSASSEPYRDVTVEIETEGSLIPRRGVARAQENSFAPAGHLQLLPKHEWQTPPETLRIFMNPPSVLMHGFSGGQQVPSSPQTWSVAKSTVEPMIAELQEALDELRKKHTDHFNAVETDADRFKQKLAKRPLHHFWPQEPIGPGASNRYRGIASSTELREVARLGNELYGELFAEGTEPRQQIETLRRGARLELYWLKSMGWVSHVPWQLVYLKPPPDDGEAVDPDAFLGLRFRLDYHAHNVGGTKALGPLGKARLACALYWGEGDQDETATAASRHRSDLKGLPGSLFVPESEADRKGELLSYLKNPEPSPVALLYFYCQCKGGTKPELRFGKSNADEYVVRTKDLAKGPLADQPMVFVNACDTAAAQPYFANQLVETFVRRKCRAFVGSECRVPIEFAQRFATAFFFYLCTPDQKGRPTSAGEAFVQARRFLFEQYGNIGGLFYSYVDQYELYIGSDDEVAALSSSTY